jgi:tetratricopeptide (TPR) repeat protein
MIKQGELTLPAIDGNVSIGRRRAAAGVLLALALGGVAGGVLATPDTATAALGASLAQIGAVVCVAAGAHLLYQWPAARRTVSVLAAALVILSVPVLIAGGYLPGLSMIAGGAAVLWLIGDRRREHSIVPAAAVVLASLVGGFLFIYLHAMNYRALLFYRGGEAVDSAPVLRSLEAAQAGGLLTFFFGFVIVLTILLAFALSWPELAEGRRPRTAAHPAAAYGGLALSMLAAVLILTQTNVRPVQADMVYKRARPYDDQATRATQADPAARRDAWDTAIAIYSAAIERLPLEDFYYLFLGRAYLERAGITQDATEQTELLARAESLLLQAQEINPLNTDHTANLARLNTRWYAAVDDEAEKAERLDLAERYYEQALILSPQNSIIRNELARLILEIRGDCDRALALYDESAAIDPFYSQTQLARADAYILCSSGRPEAERDTLFRAAAAALEEALAGNPNNVRAWVQLAEIYRRLGEFEQAAATIEEARAHHDPATFPTAEIDFLAAQVAAGLGNVAEARELAESALLTAGEETAAQIASFLAGLGDE